MGVGLAKPLEHPGQNERSDRRDDTKAKRALKRRAAGAGRVHDRLRSGQDFASLLGNGFAQGCRKHLPLGAFDQSRLKGLLKVFQSCRESGLRHVTAFRSLAEMPQIDNGDQVLKLTDGWQ